MIALRIMRGHQRVAHVNSKPVWKQLELPF